MHLTPEQLIDIVEGVAPESSAPHLAACEACRRQLVDLRAMLAQASGVDAPEPSPLFWHHFSARVREAAAAEPARAGWNWWLRAATPFALGTAAAMAIAFVIVSRLIAPPAGPPAPSPFMPPPAAATAARDLLSADVNDPSLGLMAELTRDMGWDEAREAGLAPRGSAEHAVTHLSEGELQRLRDLLQEEMTKSSD